MSNTPNNSNTIKFLIEYGWAIALTIITFVCLLFVFKWDPQLIAFSILIGTCCSMVGGFAAVLASPYEESDKKRMAVIAGTIATLITGYILAKIIDPIIAEAIARRSELFSIHNSANLLVAIIGFASGFIGTYQYRIYLSGRVKEDKPYDEVQQNGKN